MGKLYQRVGIEAPGRVNLKLDGVFQTVAIDDLPDEKLKQLYDNGCSYVQPSLEGLKKLFPNEKPIEPKRLGFEKKTKLK